MGAFRLACCAMAAWQGVSSGESVASDDAAGDTWQCLSADEALASDDAGGDAWMGVSSDEAPSSEESTADPAGGEDAAVALLAQVEDALAEELGLGCSQIRLVPQPRRRQVYTWLRPVLDSVRDFCVQEAELRRAASGRPPDADVVPRVAIVDAEVAGEVEVGDIAVEEGRGDDVGVAIAAGNMLVHNSAVIFDRLKSLALGLDRTAY